MTADQLPVTGLTDDEVRTIAATLEQTGIWVQRTVAYDANGTEVDPTDPNAASENFVFDVDYDRIVRIVIAAHTQTQNLDLDDAPTPGPTT